MEESINQNNEQPLATIAVSASAVTAPVSLRIYATLVDAATWLIPAALIGVIVYLTGVGSIANLGEGLELIILGPFVIYLMVVNIILIIRRGQSIGKHWLNIAIVNNKTGVKIGFWRFALLREFVGRTFVIGSIPFLGLLFQPFYSIVDSIFIFRKDRRTIHDMIANTKVVILPEDKKRRKLIDLKTI